MTELLPEENAEECNAERRKASLRDCITILLGNYFQDMDGHPTGELYQMVLGEVEIPLLQIILRHTNGNQSKAAEILGLNRGTLRKKLAQYGLD